MLAFCYVYVYVLDLGVVVFYLIFFFFKQKTAYEMRISDWSSDVCSSDLPHRQPHRYCMLLCSRSGHVGWLGPLGGTPVGSGGCRARLYLQIRFQIGRASCWERVCQYV